MRETSEIVVNTGPILALIAALGDLTVLQMYHRVLVPYEVGLEILQGGQTGFGVAEFEAANWLYKHMEPTGIDSMLRNSLDVGEAAVIQVARDNGVDTVCIDESMGRRVARLNGLTVTGSVGVLLRALREGHPFSMHESLARMRQHGIWLSDRVINFALREAGETL
jgi:predicted nucleic acid-binding protein